MQLLPMLHDIIEAWMSEAYEVPKQSPIVYAACPNPTSSEQGSLPYAPTRKHAHPVIASATCKFGLADKRRLCNNILDSFGQILQYDSRSCSNSLLCIMQEFGTPWKIDQYGLDTIWKAT